MNRTHYRKSLVTVPYVTVVATRRLTRQKHKQTQNHQQKHVKTLNAER